MADNQALLTAIDKLDPRELIQLRDCVQRRAQTLICTLSPEQLRARCTQLTDAVVQTILAIFDPAESVTLPE